MTEYIHMISRINWRFRSVNEKSEKVLEQYDISINRMTRGRGGIIVSTCQGVKLFTQCDKNDRYYEREEGITSCLSRQGFDCIDTYVRNNQGNIISEDEDGRKYILKNWFDARESNVRDEADMVRAVETMARMHKALKNISEDMLKKERERIVSNELLTKDDNITELKACQIKNRKKNDKNETSLRQMYERHTKELKKAYNYLKQKKGRQTFEQLAFKNVQAFYEEACRANEHLNSEVFDERLARAALEGELSHGSYNYHNVLINGKNTYVVNFDKYKNECQINDLYQFIRKVMEKYNWEDSVFYRPVDEYDRICPMSDEEMELLMTLLSYPEKFWKIINQYINANKSWIPEKNVEKLKKVIEQNTRKRELIDKICCVW